MTIVHVATELSGGAGGFVRHLHLAMLGMGLPSLVLTRERNELGGVVTLKPISRIKGSLRARTLTALGKVGLLDSSYAMFGIEKCPVSAADIQQAVEGVKPSAFVFYWTSYFVDFETMLALRQACPNVPIVLTCTDEAFLTGGCHYAHGCEGYLDSCSQCPATRIAALQRRISQRFVRRRTLIDAIDPVVIYPTSNIQDVGKRSSAMKGVRSWVIPLGAISSHEQRQAKARRAVELMRRRQQDGAVGKLILLVRSSSEFRKGCDLFVKALQSLSEVLPDLAARLKVVSIGDQTLAQAGIERYVDHEARGYVGRDELVSIYNEVDAFIVTSREDGGPLMTNECVAMGIYVISTPIGVARDLIVSERDGCITRDVSSEAMSEALLGCLRRHEADDAATVNEELEDESFGESLTFEGYILSMNQLLKSIQN